MMELMENMITKIAQDVNGTTEVTVNGQKVDLSPPWERITMYDAVKRYTGYDVGDTDIKKLKKIARELDIESESFWGPGKYIEEIFGTYVEDKITRPTYIINYPGETSPLAKKSFSDGSVVERFEAIIGGLELINGYSELNDPQEQKQRFLDQMDRRKKGDDEAQVIDEDYIMALEYGMPPTGGVGIGIDRLTMLLTETASIKDVILFPQMKPREE